MAKQKPIELMHCYYDTSDGNTCGTCCNLREFRYNSKRLRKCIAYGGLHSSKADWANRCPTWDEMCLVKDIFWQDDECVIQFHPPKSEYVNLHPYCLHLWKKIGEKADLPPKEFV